MRPTIKSLVLPLAATTVLASGFAAPASAATVFTPASQVISLVGGTGIFGATINDAKPLGGAFTHTFTFTTVAPAKSAGTTITTYLKGNNKPTDIDFSSIKLDGLSFTQLTFDTVPVGNPVESWGLLGSPIIGAGLHHIVLVGKEYSTAAAAASYSGTVNLTAVPEPASWALTIAGFGLVGAAMRRRKVQARIAFA
jgi:hypothetical protein